MLSTKSLVLLWGVGYGSGLKSNIDMSYFDTLCRIPLDLVFLQDTTGSFQNDLPNVQKQLPEILDLVNTVLPGSRFSVADFRDKPYQLLGEPTDWCHKQHVGFTRNSTEIKAAFKKVVADGGADVPEAMLHALLEIAYDREQYDWCTISQDPASWTDEGDCSGRVIIISTDAGPHDYDDYTLYNGADPDFPTPTVTPIPPMYMPPFPDSGLENLSADDWDHLCVTNEYPTEEQLIQGLKANNITLMVLVPDDDQVVVNKWVEIIADLDQPPEYLQYIANDSRDLAGALTTLFKSLLKHTCDLQIRNTSTTTTEPADTTTEQTETTTQADDTTTLDDDTTTNTGGENTDDYTTTTMTETTTTTANNTHTAANSTETATTSIEGSTTMTLETGTVNGTTIPTCSPTEVPECVWPSATKPHHVEMVIVDLKVDQ